MDLILDKGDENEQYNTYNRWSKVTVPENYTVLQAAETIGIEIPRLCYDPNLEIVGACRLCLVEVEGSPKLQTSCSLQAREGMVVYTKTEKVVKVRREILQLLLDNHPNDCLTCQKAGECLLQEYAYQYDVKFREHGGAYKANYMDTSSPYILKDDAKCILCGKCVRTCEQVAGRSVLTLANRGFDTRVVADANLSLEESSCVSCNRCVSVCPVGALLDKRAVGKARSWEVETREFKCKVCEYGCDFELLSKNGENVAVRAKAPANGRPLCLKGRLTSEFTLLDKPETPYKKENGQFVEVSWKEALGLMNIVDRLEKMESSDKK